MVPENIHTHTAEGIGNSRGVCVCVCGGGGGGGGGSMAQEIPEGRRGECMDRLVFRGSTSHSCRAQLFKIATY